MTTITAETVQEAMHKQGLKTYEELQQDVKRLELHLDIENVNKRFAYKFADKMEWRAKLWLTIAVTTWVAVLAYVAWNVIF